MAKCTSSATMIPMTERAEMLGGRVLDLHP